MFKFRRPDPNDQIPDGPMNNDETGDEPFEFDTQMDAAMESSMRSVASVEMFGTTSVLTVTQERVTADVAAEIYTLITELAADGSHHFVLDLQNATYLDSAGLGVLLRIVRVLEENGGRIALASVNPYVASLFRITRLDRAFPICRDAMSAIAAVERAA